MPQEYIMKTDNKPNNIRLFVPSGPAEQERISRGLVVMKTDDFICNLQIPCHGPEQPLPFPWLHNTDQAQAEAFNALMQEKNTAFAWAIRGGYGILRWLDRIEWDIITESSPVITGFSDLTVLHSALNSLGIKSVHGPMLCTLASTSAESRRALWNCFSWGKMPELHGNCVCTGGQNGSVTVRAGIIGGNLCSLVHLIGTPWEPPWHGNILLIEDHNEPLYKIDRMLTHLLQSKRLQQVTAVAAGEFSGTGNTEEMLHKLLADRLGCLGIPVLAGIHSGHGRNNMPILMGGKYLLDAEKCRLTPLENLIEITEPRENTGTNQR